MTEIILAEVTWPDGARTYHTAQTFADLRFPAPEQTTVRLVVWAVDLNNQGGRNNA